MIPNPTAACSRKRRLYADYRELLAFETQARRLNLPSFEKTLPTVSEDRTTPEEPPVPPVDVNPLDEHSYARVDASQTGPTIAIVVDQRMSMFYGSRRNLKSVVAANAAALIAWRLHSLGRLVSAVVFNDRKITQVRPSLSRLHILMILQSILAENHGLRMDAGGCSNPGMLNDVLRRVDKLKPRASMIFLITDGSGHDPETSRLLTNIRAHSDVLVTLVSDPMQAESSRVAKSKFDGAAPALEAVRDPQASGEGSCAASDGKAQPLKRLFSDEVPVISLNTRDDLARQFRRAFAGPMSRSLNTTCRQGKCTG